MGIYEDSRKLEQLLGQPAGSLLPSRTTLGIIREKIKGLIGDSPVPLPCQELYRTYNSMLQRANNAVSGGGSPSTLATVWGNFISAAIALFDCLDQQE